MQRDQVSEPGELRSADHWRISWGVERREGHVDEVLLRPPVSYIQAFGDEPIRVGIIQCRILLFLASRPYHAFTCRQISDAISTESHPLTEESVDAQVATLRDQLGVFHDFVQTVPHVGYRFKA